MARTILHASDLHFGTTTPALVEDLLEQISFHKPDIVVISGDFTQDGQSSEFREAQDFIKKVPVPVFTIPGNHDVPGLDLMKRFLEPYTLYKKYINAELNPYYEDETCVMVGINTARRILPHWNWSHGMISHGQISYIRKSFESADPHKYRVLVCHHPPLAALNAPMKTIVWGRERLMPLLLALNVDLVLTGHVHHASVTMTGDTNGQIAFVGASTATSSRVRSQANGYNLITMNDDMMSIECMHWQKGDFVLLQKDVVRRNRH